VEFDAIRPILSGLAGAIIASALVSYWTRRLPESFNEKSREVLLREQRAAVWSANALFFAGILLGLAMYQFGGFARTDWRPLGIGFGLGSVLPLVALVLIPFLSGRSVAEAFVAFASGQGSPLWVTYGILGAGVVALVLALAAFVT
jgi:hypothetical protein